MYNQNQNEMRKLAFVLFGLFAALMVLIAVMESGKEGNEVTKTVKIDSVSAPLKWEEMNENQQKEWIIEELNYGKYDYETWLKGEVRKNFQYPNSVEFHEGSFFRKDKNTIIIDAPSGTCYTNWFFTAKNAFAMETNYQAQITFNFTPSNGLVVEKINIIDKDK